MKQFSVFFLLTIFSLLSVAQKRFDVSATGKLGYYFPGTENTPYFSPDNTFSPGLGVSFNYHVFKRTTLSLGLEGVYLKPAMIDHYREPIDVKWHRLDIPFEIRQGIGESFFVAGGATLARQITGYRSGQKIPEYNWQTGIGWMFEKFALSLHYEGGFSKIEKKITLGPNEWATTDIKHREVYLKISYPLSNLRSIAKKQ